MRKLKFLAIIIPFLYIQLTFAITKDGLNPRIQNFIDHWRTTNRIPGQAVSIYQPNIGMITVTSGNKLSSPSKYITPQSLFQIGSITKTFISAAILQLEVEGKLSIDDKIGQWFPEYPRWSNITIKELLNMTCGIARYEENPLFTQTIEKNPQKNWTADELIKLAYQQTDYFKHGTSWHYTNTSYLLAGKIIEKTTQKHLETFLKNYFLNKFKLNHTYYLTQNSKRAIASMAHGYRNDKDITTNNLSAYGAAGGMASTSQDIAVWGNVLFSGKVLPEKQLKEFLSTVPFDAPPKPKGSRYGLGIYYLHSKTYGDIWWYSGVTEGYISLLIYLPKYNLTVTSTVNQIRDDNYWLLMPNRSFVTEVLATVTKKLDS